MRLLCIFVVVWGLGVAGCATGPLYSARQDFYSGRPQAALDTLNDSRTITERDRLLFLMERGLILHELGEYQNSVQVLREAVQLMDQQETVSLSQQSAALLTSDWVTEYKGEYCERLWVHTYAMMNYLLLGQFESALVEAKQALEVVDRYAEPLTGDYFTRALIAHCFEALREFNGAYIEYRKLSELLPDPRIIAHKLFYLASMLGFAEDAAKYKTMLPPAGARQPADNGELALLIGLGRMPVKVSSDIVLPPSIRISFPRYADRGQSAAEVIVSADSVPLDGFSVSTNLGAVAREALSMRAKEYATRMAARVAIKETLAQVAGHEDAALGVLLRVAFFVIEEADTRGWETLPATLKLMIIPLPPGSHDIRLSFRNSHGAEVREIMLPDTEIAPHRKTYRSIRLTD